MRKPAWPSARFVPVFWLGMLVLLGAVQAQPVSVQDERGRTVRLEQPARRIVSLLPSLTETVCALGACDRLVGVDRDSNFPDSVKKLTLMVGGLDPQIERIVASRPDLVLMAVSARGADRLEALGLKVAAFEPQNRAGAERALYAVQALLGGGGERLQALLREIDAGVQAAGRSLPPDRRAWRVYMEVGSAPHGASEASFLGETLSGMGLANILPARLGPFPRINPEWVLRADPDLMLLIEGSLAQWMQRPGWAGLSAVRAGRVCSFKPEESDVLLRPGPRMAEAARLLAQCVQRVPARSR